MGWLCRRLGISCGVSPDSQWGTLFRSLEEGAYTVTWVKAQYRTSSQSAEHEQISLRVTENACSGIRNDLKEVFCLSSLGSPGTGRNLVVSWADNTYCSKGRAKSDTHGGWTGRSIGICWFQIEFFNLFEKRIRPVRTGFPQKLMTSVKIVSDSIELCIILPIMIKKVNALKCEYVKKNRKI